MTSPRIGTHNVFKKYAHEPRRYSSCQHIHYVNSQPVECGAETLHGVPTCDKCKKLEGTGATGSKFRGVPASPRTRFA